MLSWLCCCVCTLRGVKQKQPETGVLLTRRSRTEALHAVLSAKFFSCLCSSEVHRKPNHVGGTSGQFCYFSSSSLQLIRRQVYPLLLCVHICSWALPHAMLKVMSLSLILEFCNKSKERFKIDDLEFYRENWNCRSGRLN